MRKYINETRISPTTRFRLLERLVRADDEQAGSLVSAWLEREDDSGKRWLRDNLSKWGAPGRKLALERWPE